MGRKTSLIIEGVEFDSISNACRHYDISPQTFAYRTKKGLTPEEALTRFPYLKFDSKDLVMRDFQKLQDRARKLGFSLN